jgi:cupin 2 domain-containing protein
MIAKTNLFQGIPASSAEEWIQTVSAGPHCRIERIVSWGQASPPGFWYDQTWDEWVLLLRGHARLQFAESAVEVDLTMGDALFIPAHLRHRVVWTDPAAVTIWLAVHSAPTPAD